LQRECVRYHADVKFYTFEIVIEKEEDGQPIPQNEKLVHVEELTVGIP